MTRDTHPLRIWVCTNHAQTIGPCRRTLPYSPHRLTQRRGRRERRRESFPFVRSVHRCNDVVLRDVGKRSPRQRVSCRLSLSVSTTRIHRSFDESRSNQQRDPCIEFLLRDSAALRIFDREFECAIVVPAELPRECHKHCPCEVRKPAPRFGLQRTERHLCEAFAALCSCASAAHSTRDYPRSSSSLSTETIGTTSLPMRRSSIRRPTARSAVVIDRWGRIGVTSARCSVADDCSLAGPSPALTAMAARTPMPCSGRSSCDDDATDELPAQRSMRQSTRSCTRLGR